MIVSTTNNILKIQIDIMAENVKIFCGERFFYFYCNDADYLKAKTEFHPEN